MTMTRIPSRQTNSQARYIVLLLSTKLSLGILSRLKTIQSIQCISLGCNKISVSIWGSELLFKHITNSSKKLTPTLRLALLLLTSTYHLSVFYHQHQNYATHTHKCLNCYHLDQSFLTYNPTRHCKRLED